MKFLRTLTERGRYAAALLLMLLVAVVFAMARPDGSTPPKAPALPLFPPTIYFAVLAFGMLGHWIKGYSRGTITEGIGAYIVTNMGQTFSALVANVGALVLLWKTSPGEMLPISFFSVWSVFMTAYVGNSALNGTGPFIAKPATPPAGG